eukprot:8701772-Pyramimonas_sp.AAC.1
MGIPGRAPLDLSATQPECGANRGLPRRHMLKESANRLPRPLRNSARVRRRGAGQSGAARSICLLAAPD